MSVSVFNFTNFLLSYNRKVVQGTTLPSLMALKVVKPTAFKAFSDGKVVVVAWINLFSFGHSDPVTSTANAH